MTRLALMLMRPLSVSGDCPDPAHQVRSAASFSPHGRQPSGDQSRVRDQYQPALHVCTLNFLMGCDHLLQGQARRDHRLEFTGGEQREKAREIVAVPVRVLLFRRSCVVERDVLLLWRQ